MNVSSVEGILVFFFIISKQFHLNLFCTNILDLWAGLNSEHVSTTFAGKECQYSKKADGGALTMPLAAGNERPLVACKCRSYCVYKDIILFLAFIKNNTVFPIIIGREYSVIDVESSTIHWKRFKIV